MAAESANPLLLQWLKEWMDEAHERNSKGYLVYKKAYLSMKECSTTFHHPSEALRLNGIGPKLCDRLTEKLKAYCTDNALPMPRKAESRKASNKSNADRQEEDQEEASEEPQKKKRKVKEYVPTLRSGAYAIIMALSELDQDGRQALPKADLIIKAQPFCDASFTTPSDPTKFFTAWKSMSTLESKELVCTKGHPTKRYCLSDEGRSVALRVKANVGSNNREAGRSTVKGKNISHAPKSVSSARPAPPAPDEAEILDLSSASEPEMGPHATPLPVTVNIKDSSRGSKYLTSITPRTSDLIRIKPGTFEIKLLLDTREIRTPADRDYISSELKKHGISSEIRSLPLGDVLWIAKLKRPHDGAFRLKNPGDDDEGSDEIVLEHVIERKRLDDLVYSIRDGRFHEQKFRLKKSGMRHVTYLVEDYSMSAERIDKVGESLDSAIASMQMVNNIFVKQTPKLDETIQYIARMTQSLKETYEQKELCVFRSESLDVATYLSVLDSLRADSPSDAFCITFSALCSLCDKSDNLTLRDVYLKMLMCTRGVTSDKAVEIQKIWPTPNALIEAYASLNGNQAAQENLISDRLSNKIDRKKVAKTLSAKIGEVWSS